MDIKKTTKEEIIKVINSSKSMREIILYFGLSPNGSSGYRSVKDRLKKLEIEIPEFNYYGIGGKKIKRLDEDVFIENSTFPRQKIKDRIIKKKTFTI